MQQKMAAKPEGRIAPVVRPKVKKRWLLEWATEDILSRKSVKPQLVERLIGYYTHIFLLRRPLLSIFHSPQ